jgi:uncharacterized protein (DUF58 family)
MRYNVVPLITLTVLSLFALFIALGTFTIALTGIDAVLWFYFILSLRTVKKLELSAKIFPSRVFTDDEVTCEVSLTNKSKFTLSSVEIQDFSSDGYIVSGDRNTFGSIDPGKSLSLKYSLKYRVRGEHTFYRVKIKSESSLRLFSIERYFDTERKVLVFPKILPIEKFKTILIEPVDGRKTDFKILEDSSHIVGVHEYSDEPFQRIHWKISAHTDQLMVKEYEYTGSSNVRIYIDYNLPREIYARNVWASMRKDYEEYASMAASAIVKYLFERGMPITLKVLGKEIIEITPQMVRDYIPYLDALAIAKGTDEPEDGLLLQNQLISDMYSMSKTTTVVIISMYLTDGIIPILLTAKSRAARLIVFVMPYGFRMPYDKKYDTYAILPGEIKRLRDQSIVLIENNVMIHVMMDNESVDEVIKRYERSLGTL